MRAMFLLPFIFLFQTYTYAQEYEKLRLGIGGGNIILSTHVPGILVYLEPSYKLNDRFALAFRFENMAGAPLMTGNNNETINAMASYTLNGQYYLLSKGSVRPFVGLGFGAFTPNRGIFGCDCKGEPKNTTVFGFYPRVGFDFHHMTLSIDYNVVQTVKQNIEYFEPMFNGSLPSYYNAKTSYLAFRFGFFIGGGQKAILKSD